MTNLLLPVEEYTTPNPVTLDVESSIDEIRKTFLKNEIRHVPITKNNRIVGIISDRDLKVVSCLGSKELTQLKAYHLMTENPVTVNAQDTLDEVVFEMSEKKIGSVIVNDENDEFYGIFTVTDALNALVEIVRAADIKDV